MRIRRTPVPVVLPDGLPVLAAGVHLSPEDGVCLMEYVSVLAGERFSDSPRCTDAGLASLARLVNDEASDEGRPLLAPLAADLTVLGRADPVGSARLVLAVITHAQTTAGPSPKLRRAERRARLRLQRVSAAGARGRLMRASTPVHMRGAGRHRLIAAFNAVAEARWPDHGQRDEALLELLRVAMSSVRGSRTPLLEQTWPGGKTYGLTA
jgi:hypothetical protein